MDIKELERAVAKVQTSLFRNSNSFSIGMLKSHFRGSGLQFKEHQVYCHGDDVRFIDWKMLAKTTQPYIKTFDEERNVEIVVLLDLSPSMLYGHKGVSKLKAGIDIICLLMLLAKETNDYIHVFFVSDKIVQMPKTSGKKGIVELILTLEKEEVMNSKGEINLNYRPKHEPDLEKNIKVIKQNLKRRREVLLLSDFYHFIPPAEIKTLSSHNNIHCIKVVSPLDEAKVLPYSLLGQKSYQTNRATMINVDRRGEKVDPLAKILGRKLKKINVSERYLETFIKEME